MSPTPAAPASDLRLEVVDLIGRPGAHRSFERTVIASGEEGTLAMRVPADEPIALRGEIESVIEGLYVSGTVQAHLTGECSRCLDPVEEDVDARIDELFTYPEKVPADADPDDIVTLEGDSIDLAGLVHDTIAVNASERPLCSPDCQGLCPQCGIRMEEDPEHHHDVIDPRFAALQGMFPADEDAAEDGNA
ncbi:YceD family protein [Brachybacterium hainanense]|uniref:DUF177 domain-containing protein n=1 Tax=Brachybacterium hainanense TaxID=1541174 RepID=A0ABV6R967_9MICO